MSAESFTFASLGCGQRGRIFGAWLLEHPEAGRIVAVAEPDDERRNTFADRHNVPETMRFRTWEALLAQPRLADVVLNALMDQLHRPSAVAALERGYHMLLEKPMAVTPEDCEAINEARKKAGTIVSVCHSMRYHAVYAKVRQLIDEGAIGNVISLDQLEGVDPVHQAHSFVRGNWHREENAVFMLMAKSCHDIDLLYYMAGGKPCRRVSSFGSLTHFTREQGPEGAPDRCLDGCPFEKDCPYSATKVYLSRSKYADSIGITHWSDSRIKDFLQTSDYGRCVYRCANNVVDHQVVNMEFEDGATGTFTMTAFAPEGRLLRVHGSHGYIEADISSNTVEVHEFWREMRHTVINVPQQEGSHGGADGNVMANLIDALRTNDPDAVLTTTEESLYSHSIVFAAEESRRTGKIVELH